MILLSCTKLAVGEKIPEPRGTGPDGVRSIGFPGVRLRTALVSLPFRLMLLAFPVQERHLKYDRITTAAVMSVVFSTHVARIVEGIMMAFFQKVPNLIPIDLDNVASNDWIILLEANTIVNSSGELRVARTTQERKIVWRFRSLRRRPFLVIDGYDPRIHTLYFCPQLYKHDEHGRLVPLEGEEIGRLLAKTLEGKVKLRLPWYEPSHKLPADSIIAGDLNKEFDTLVIDAAPDRPRLVASTGSEGAAG